MNNQQQKIIVQLFGKWYDLTEFSEMHPGGKEILEKLNGKDGTDSFFEAGHLSNHAVLQHLSRLPIIEKPKL
ncbi:unnamed protein product (macronuclear) [Paramecium tetraurelia]|uniref:Cytochrome b5 heme-binding domain-containing protein n=1 Tax=Paramecium tetraurelia TaxID=5888 RepID=A0E4I5_PARTE|nr:uncharacterized protein GSPATT00023377001 [Paramecium tetraurelia]CAK90202.1 unnamed protein product [Paramecium tetraurelia]|eukprot:XP_001457599.1 hypothetical protein (macronuclear) [Paramecium tetraurelia strain d4-2]